MVPMHTTSVSLLERLRLPQEEKAWERFVELYTPLLIYWARNAGLQTQDAVDLVQDVFVTLLQKLPEFRYDQSKSFRSWLRTIVMNKWRDGQRKVQRRPAAGEKGLSGVADKSGADAFWEREYREQLFRRALEIMKAEFEPATWQACWAVVVEGRSSRDVAKELGMTENAVYLAKFRVMRKLRREFEDMLD